MFTARWRKVVITVAGLSVFIGAGTVTAVLATAATAGCAATYQVTEQSADRFTASVTVRNLGPALSPWMVRWSFPGDQRIVQGWRGGFSQSGRVVTVTGQRTTRRVATNRTIRVAFTATTSSNSTASNTIAPTELALNGVRCSAPGGSAPAPGPTGSPMPTSAAPVPTRSPGATTGPSPSGSVPPGGLPTSGWNPPGQLAAALAEVWQHQEHTYNNGNLYAFKNYAWDQLMAGQGTLNYCVRWDSTRPVSSALRDQIHTALAGQVKRWIDQLVDGGAGWNGWPYPQVSVKVVGWAVRDRATLQWSDNSVDVYVNNIRENAPQCAEPCGRFFNQGGQYPTCPGGANHHYDMSLWLTDGFGGGHGGDWGQRLGTEYFTGALGNPDIYILLHELGHSFGLDDFYDWTPTGVDRFIMKAGSSMTITEFDRWMLRDWWRHLQSRY